MAQTLIVAGCVVACVGVVALAGDEDFYKGNYGPDADYILSGGLIKDLIRKLNGEKGVTFVIVTHDESFTDMASRTARMVDGRIAGT